MHILLFFDDSEKMMMMKNDLLTCLASPQVIICIQHVNLFAFRAATTSSDDDIDPELREGINNIM